MNPNLPILKQIVDQDFHPDFLENNFKMIFQDFGNLENNLEKNIKIIFQDPCQNILTKSFTLQSTYTGARRAPLYRDRKINDLFKKYFGKNLEK